MANKDELKGKSERLTGKVKKKAGDLTDNDRLRSEGTTDEVVGKSRDTMGQAKRKVGDAVENAGGKLKR